MKKRKLTRMLIAEYEATIHRLMGEAKFWQQNYDEERALTTQLTNKIYPPDMATKTERMDVGGETPTTPRKARKRPVKRGARRTVVRRKRG